MSAPSIFQQAVQLHKSRQLDKAIELYYAHLETGADPAAEHYLGLALVQSRQVDAGLRHLRNAAAAEPENTLFLTNLAKALLQSSHKEDARTTYGEIVRRNPRDAESWNNLAGLERQSGDLAKAIKAYQKALSLRDHPAIALNLGLVAKDAGQRDLARESFAKVISQSSKPVRALIQIASMDTEDGKFEQAEKHLSKAHALAPENARVLASLLTLRSYSPTPELLRMAKRVVSQTQDLDDKTRLSFGIARALQRQSAHDEAWYYAVQANKIVSETSPFDPAALAQELEILRATFNPSLLDHLSKAEGNGAGLVFIIGLPRTGTTLVEQILSSHPDVFGADERPEIPAMVSRLTTDEHPYPIALNHLPLARLRNEAETHENKMLALSPSARKIIDKLPFNFSHAGLIAGLFPKASIIHCQRDLRDVFVSCFFTEFTDRLQGFRTSAENFAAFANTYRQVMAHWESLIHGRIHHVQYEALIADFDTLAPQILEACGLDWHEDCRSFFATERTIRTPSRWQVRQPLYTSSMERWRDYEAHLGPVADLVPLS